MTPTVIMPVRSEASQVLQGGTDLQTDSLKVEKNRRDRSVCFEALNGVKPTVFTRRHFSSQFGLRLPESPGQV